MLIPVEYKPSKLGNPRIQLFHAYIYPEHHTLDKHLVSRVGVDESRAMKWVERLKSFNIGRVSVDLLRHEAVNPAWRDYRGTEGDVDPLVIKGRILPHFSLEYQWKDQNPAFSFREPTRDRPLKYAEKKILLEWFEQPLKDALTEEVIKRLHTETKEEYIIKTLDTLSRAITGFRELSEKLHNQFELPDYKFVCPVCNGQLFLSRESENPIDIDRGSIVHSEVNNTIHCGQCGWEDNGSNYLEIVDINLSISKIF